MDPKLNGIKENQGNGANVSGKQGEGQESIREKVLRLLEAQTPWNKIAKSCHVSTKTIAKIRGSAAGSTPSGRDENESINQSGYEDYGYLGERWAGKTLGQIASASFALFQKSMEPFDVVRRLELPPSLVKRLFAEFKTMSEHANGLCKKCYETGLEDGKVTTTHTITSQCPYCKVDINWNLDDPSNLGQIMKILKKGGIEKWAHVKCTPKDGGNERGETGSPKP